MIRLLLIVAWLAVAIPPLSAWGVLASKDSRESELLHRQAEFSVLGGLLMLAAGLCVVAPIRQPMQRLPRRLLHLFFRTVQAMLLLFAAASVIPTLVFIAIEGVTVAMRGNPYRDLPTTHARAAAFVEQVGLPAALAVLAAVALLVADDLAARGRFGLVHRILLAALFCALSATSFLQWQRLPELGLFGSGLKELFERAALVAAGAVALAAGLAYRLASAWPPETPGAPPERPGASLWSWIVLIAALLAAGWIVADLYWLQWGWVYMNFTSRSFWGRWMIHFTIPTDLSPSMLKAAPSNLFLWFWFVGGAVVGWDSWLRLRGTQPTMPKTRWEVFAWWWIGLSILFVQVLPLLAIALGPAGFLLLVMFS